jgi:hypothetical protein
MEAKWAPRTAPAAAMDAPCCSGRQLPQQHQPCRALRQIPRRQRHRAAVLLSAAVVGAPGTSLERLGSGSRPAGGSRRRSAQLNATGALVAWGSPEDNGKQDAQPIDPGGVAQPADQPPASTGEAALPLAVNGAEPIAAVPAPSSSSSNGDGAPQVGLGVLQLRLACCPSPVIIMRATRAHGAAPAGVVPPPHAAGRGLSGRTMGLGEGRPGEPGKRCVPGACMPPCRHSRPSRAGGGGVPSARLPAGRPHHRHTCVSARQCWSQHRRAAPVGRGPHTPPPPPPHRPPPPPRARAGATPHPPYPALALLGVGMGRGKGGMGRGKGSQAPRCCHRFAGGERPGLRGCARLGPPADPTADPR